jgi:hypothetical protein
MGRATARFTVLIGVLALARCAGNSNASSSAAATRAADGTAVSQPVSSAGGSGAKMAVLHAAITITGGLTATGAFDDPLPVATCADVAALGTMRPPTDGSMPLFNVPEPPEVRGNPGSVGGGHTFSSDVSAIYKGPGTYTGRQLNATQMRVDTPPGSEDIHIFAHPDSIGTMVVKPDASGSFQFSGWQDPGSVTISGQITWTCAEHTPSRLRALARLTDDPSRAVAPRSETAADR